MVSGYLQIEIEEQIKEKTELSTLPGHFHFNKMCFGLMNAPATYQRCMDSILLGLRGVDFLCYLDDLTIFSPDVATHVEKLQRVFDRLRGANFRIQPDKCQFAIDKVEYLGYIVTSEGVKPDPSKVKAIREYPQPKNVKEIRSFVGLASYYRRHVPNFADTALPLTKLTKKNEKFKWENEQENAFQKLKEILSTEPLLIYQDFSQPFVVTCDVSNTAVGAVLSQLRDGKEKPIAYCSRQLNSAKRNYSCTERELLAVIFATKQFRCYLYGYRFTLQTDHSALRWLLNLKDPSSRLPRWSLRLAEFDYEIFHRPGKKMSHADALSRNVGSVFYGESITEARLTETQQNDAFCTSLKNDNEFYQSDGGLWHKIIENTKENTSEYRVVIPEELVPVILQHYHSTPMSGHQGIHRTIALIQHKYWWLSVRQDVNNFVQTCDKCARRKDGNIPKAPLGEPPVANEFLEILATDFIGPLPTTKDGNTYILTFVDHLRPQHTLCFLCILYTS